MKIALLISGRATRYDVCLLPMLKNSIHEIDVFMAINDEFDTCEYYNNMKSLLKSWLKGCIIKKYIIPEDIKTLFNSTKSISTHGGQVNLQKIDDKYLPSNCLSMYYNDNLSFMQACEYADKNAFEYDCYMKFRSDIIIDKIPDNLFLPNNNTLHSAIPMCNFTSCGIYKKPIVCDIIAWGNRQSMSIYCNTYNYVLGKNLEYNGTYYIAGECSLTDNIYENNIVIAYHNIPYLLDKNRRMFDNIANDTRESIPTQQYLLKITDSNSSQYINRAPG
jgi:hypothetical protein